MTEYISKMNEFCRPFLTLLIATIFNLICAYCVIFGKLSIKDYLTAIAPTNSMIIGFWFGERSALKDPKSP